MSKKAKRARNPSNKSYQQILIPVLQTTDAQHPQKLGVARPPIPEGIKREVRKRCGFGCVLCGFPIYDYEHMKEWAIVKRHIASEITLLCPQHHREKTVGLLSPEVVSKYNNSPVNLMNAISRPYSFHLYGTENIIEIGGTSFIYHKTYDMDTGVIAFSIDGQCIIGFRLVDQNLLLNLSIFDHEDNQIITIKNNELVFSTEFWDITFIGNKFTVRSQHGRVYFVLRIVPEEGVVRVEKADLRYHGYVAKIERESMSFPGSNNKILGRGRFLGSGVLMNLGGEVPPGAMWHIYGRRTYGPDKEEPLD